MLTNFGGQTPSTFCEVKCILGLTRTSGTLQGEGVQKLALPQEVCIYGAQRCFVAHAGPVDVYGADQVVEDVFGF